MPKYDLAIAGAGLGGFASAALLSARGKKVLVCTPHASLAGALGVVAADGFLFSSGPSLLHGFEPGGPFRSLLRDSGIHDWEYAPAAVYQVALPDRRINISQDQAETNEELRREFPREIQSLIKFYSDLGRAAARIAQNRVAAFIVKHRSAGSFIRKYRFSSEASAFFDVQALHFFQRPCSELSLDALITLCTRGPVAFSGEYGKLAERFADVLRRRGCEVRLNEPTAEVVYQRNRAAGIKTAYGVVDAGKVLICTSEKSTPAMLIGIRDEVVPVGMERDVLYLPDYGQPRDFFACSLSGKGDAATAPAGMRALAVTCHGSGEQMLDPDSLIARISGLVPFLKDFSVLTRDTRSSEASAPAGLTLKPFRLREREPLLFKTTNRNLYLLNETRHAPLKLLPAVQRFVDHVT